MVLLKNQQHYQISEKTRIESKSDRDSEQSNKKAKINEYSINSASSKSKQKEDKLL